VHQKPFGAQTCWEILQHSPKPPSWIKGLGSPGRARGGMGTKERGGEGREKGRRKGVQGFCLG